MDASFTEAEQRFVLAEMIKVSPIDIGALVDFVKSHNVQPDWLSMQVPNGRNVKQCIQVAEKMGMVNLQPPPVPAIKRKSLGDLNEPYSKRVAMSPLEMQPSPYSRNVNIKPRPIPNGFAPHPIIQGPTGVPSPGGQAVGKKRGRPSKADKEAKMRANASTSTFPAVLAPAPAPVPTTMTSNPPPMRQPSQEYSTTTQRGHGQRESLNDAMTKEKPRQSMSDRSQPRAPPELPLDQADKSPAVGNLLNKTSPIESLIPQEGAAVHKATRSLNGQGSGSPAIIPKTEVEAIKNGHHSVNTTA